MLYRTHANTVETKPTVAETWGPEATDSQRPEARLPHRAVLSLHAGRKQDLPWTFVPKLGFKGPGCTASHYFNGETILN